MSFRREKYIPRGGPDGGNGGRGGNVILYVDPQVNTLLDVGRQYLWSAEKGRQGSGKNQFGRSGEDLRVPVPQGTLVRDRESLELLVDLDTPGMEYLIARGGSGGKGNRSFATATHQSPREWEKGEPEEERLLLLELKLMADVGLAGLPNAGKSTLLGRVSAAKPRVADYPFTTRVPQLGIVEIGPTRRLTVADIPGLIKGAHQGVGLGIEFLKHIERTGALIHLVDPREGDVDAAVTDWQTIRNELGQYSAELLKRPIITVLNKLDLFPDEEAREFLAAFRARVGPALGISAVSGRGVPGLLEHLWKLVHPDAEAE